MKLNLEFEVEPGGVDMCKSMERRMQKEKVTGAIKGMRIAGMNDEDILIKVIEAFHVTREYVLALLTPKPA